jgi:hypothetical protein
MRFAGVVRGDFAIPARKLGEETANSECYRMATLRHRDLIAFRLIAVVVNQMIVIMIHAGRLFQGMPTL